MSMVYRCVKGMFGILKLFESDKGCCPSQIAGIITFTHLSLLNLTHLVVEKLEPFVCQLQLAVIGFVIVVGLGHTIVDVTHRTEIIILVFHQFGIMLQRLNSRLRLFHVQIDDAYLLVGHCTT